jgi:hypothetical protein
MNAPCPTYSLGLDVQVARGCPYVLLDDTGQPADAGWLRGGQDEVAGALSALVDRLGSHCRLPVAVGIDAPRRPLPSARQWYWEGSTAQWRCGRPADRGNGRHCEVVIAAHRLANPQWTPTEGNAPPWMQLGFALFESLKNRTAVHEVFPSASYRMLAGDMTARIGLRLGDFYPDPKDMLDAYIAAATVREFVQGRGSEAGGGDGLGTIVLPRPLPRNERLLGVLQWPPAAARAHVPRAASALADG